jgi:hypothetical protein
MIKSFLLDLFPAIILIFHFLDKWYLSKGKLWPVYVLTACGSLCTICFNCLLYSSLDGDHKSVLLFSVNSFWTTIMAVKGTARLIKARRKCNESSSL